MKNKTFIGLIILIAAIGFSVLSCASGGGASKVIVRINLGDSKHVSCTPVRAFFNSVISFFEREAAADAPSNIVSVELNVTGSGMDDIHQSYAAPVPSSIEVEVPSGNKRIFELLVSTPSVTFRGTATKDLPGGETVDLPIAMALYETKIIIPDFGNPYLSNPIPGKIVQLNDARDWNPDNPDSYGCIARYGNDVSSTYYVDSDGSQFSPYDIDFDNHGRIYIANAKGEGFNGILIIDDINSKVNTPPIIDPNGSQVIALAVDRRNNDVYYADLGNQLFRNSETTPLANYATPTDYQIMTITGIDMGENGYLYISGQTIDQYMPCIFKYNPNTQTVEKVYHSASLDYPSDVIAKSNGLYVSVNTSGSTFKQILQLDSELNYINGYGTFGTSALAPGLFFGAAHFAGVLNKRFYLIDEYTDWTGGRNYDRIVSFSDMAGDNWLTYSGDIDNYFTFYYNYN